MAFGPGPLEGWNLLTLWQKKPFLSETFFSTLSVSWIGVRVLTNVTFEAGTCILSKPYLLTKDRLIRPFEIIYAPGARLGRPTHW